MFSPASVCLLAGLCKNHSIDLTKSGGTWAKEETFGGNRAIWIKGFLTEYYHCVHNLRNYLLIFTFRHRMHLFTKSVKTTAH